MQLQASGKVTYNGHGMEEFVPERTAAYISQHDLHIGEMTVRETLAFSARCQGVGSRFGKFYTILSSSSCLFYCLRIMRDCMVGRAC
jgi:ABC-type multidrug transport system ATPase subunit